MISVPPNLRALTVKDPWATLIAIGAKRVETRAYRTRHQGSIAIHSSKALDREDQELYSHEPYHTTLQRAGIRSPDDMSKSAIIAVAEIVACDQVPGGSGWEDAIPPEPERSFGIYQPGRWRTNTASLPPPAQGSSIPLPFPRLAHELRLARLAAGHRATAQ